MREAASLLGILGGLGMAGVGATGLVVWNEDGGDFGAPFVLVLALGVMGLAGGVGAVNRARWAATLMFAAGILELPIASVGFLTALLPVRPSPYSWEQAVWGFLFFLPSLMLIAGSILAQRHR